MVTLEHLTKKYADFTAVKNLDGTIEDGCIYGLVGFNGAGKTTLLKTIAGVYRADAGRVLVNGENIYENERLKSGVFLLSDDMYFLPQSTLKEMAKFYRGYYPAWSEKTFEKITALFELDPAARINGYSKGMHRQAGMVLALAAHPHTLLLDEAFDGLDLAKRRLLARILKEYAREKGAVVIVASHNLRELENLVDHLGIIKDHVFYFNDSIEAMKRSRSKYRAQFGPDVTLEALGALHLSLLAKEDDGFSFLCEGNEAAVHKTLDPLGLTVLERMPMTLEEFFMEQREGQEDAFTDLF
ncbi:ABC transporter ATP-binding protein [Ethanoligenens harbinense]|uniref:ABC transporter related protein n=1 Tax=Ethanoligenens harbinense (strain DSM 18485 / JCM 12961 / CGMCC 1.5033 / YUAN-3) TaxID=663278 RepID=E6U3X2_ETHHY|nr:ABC transporter ATP-binding protein [Ethanoligenens harbinense]ADU26539.1 ABC transporter related protein [Ethanoligenens harbinense YUAN-3]AVQ95665.1 ABC transporter ATP-binding protein [Ethanoligenens harbinense YUAN-3]AYF38328.1 ABC transporter ATP-binding protein [Ethanoligenens harbinense]AYF41073.1 ABC transporter ATP-binding protein [Ethanoligenens harbinense]QCN91904.1 ABC transporter ATP-binding protein [Ethanoligenens harbinense]